MRINLTYFNHKAGKGIRKILSVFFSTFIFSISAFGSETDDPLYELLTQNRQYECLDFVSNAKGMLPDYFNLGKRDSAIMIMQYVENRCGVDVFETLRLLLEIESGDLSPKWCDSDYVNEILETKSYRRCSLVVPSISYFFNRLYGENESKYNEFNIEFAKELAAKTDSSSFAHAICEILAGHKDIVLERLSASQFEGTCLQEKYIERMIEVEHDLKSFRSHWEINTGIWRPIGVNNVLGDKIELGGALGYKESKLGLDLIGGIRFLNAREEYMTNYNHEFITTDFFRGSYAEIALNYDIYSYENYDLECFVGVGYDGFVAVPKKDDQNLKVLDGWGFSIGFENRLFYNRLKTRYVGILFRYDFMNYENKGGTDLPNNAISVNLVWGYFGNSYQISRAKELHYYDWKENQ